MTEHQKPQESTERDEGKALKTGTASATASLAAAVAKRAEARTQADKRQDKGTHGGRPMSNVRMAAQVKGK